MDLLLIFQNEMRISWICLAFIDNSSRGPSRKKRLSQADTQDEPYVDLKVFP